MQMNKGKKNVECCMNDNIDMVLSGGGGVCEALLQERPSMQWLIIAQGEHKSTVYRRIKNMCQHHLAG